MYLVTHISYSSEYRPICSERLTKLLYTFIPHIKVVEGHRSCFAKSSPHMLHANTLLAWWQQICLGNNTQWCSHALVGIPTMFILCLFSQRIVEYCMVHILILMNWHQKKLYIRRFEAKRGMVPKIFLLLTYLLPRYISYIWTYDLWVPILVILQHKMVCTNKA